MNTAIYFPVSSVSAVVGRHKFRDANETLEEIIRRYKLKQKIVIPVQEENKIIVEKVGNWNDEDKQKIEKCDKEEQSRILCDRGTLVETRFTEVIDSKPKEIEIVNEFISPQELEASDKESNEVSDEKSDEVSDEKTDKESDKVSDKVSDEKTDEVSTITEFVVETNTSEDDKITTEVTKTIETTPTVEDEKVTIAEQISELTIEDISNELLNIDHKLTSFKFVNNIPEKFKNNKSLQFLDVCEDVILWHLLFNEIRQSNVYKMLELYAEKNDIKIPTITNESFEKIKTIIFNHVLNGKYSKYQKIVNDKNSTLYNLIMLIWNTYGQVNLYTIDEDGNYRTVCRSYHNHAKVSLLLIKDKTNVTCGFVKSLPALLNVRKFCDICMATTSSSNHEEICLPNYKPSLIIPDTTGIVKNQTYSIILDTTNYSEIYEHFCSIFPGYRIDTTKIQCSHNFDDFTMSGITDYTIRNKDDEIVGIIEFKNRKNNIFPRDKLVRYCYDLDQLACYYKLLSKRHKIKIVCLIQRSENGQTAINFFPVSDMKKRWNIIYEKLLQVVPKYKQKLEELRSKLSSPNITT